MFTIFCLQIFIERKDGCDQMVCTKCNTSFCYRCGDRFMDFKFFGNHTSRLSPLGCKYNYKPDEPVKRKLVRGLLLGKLIKERDFSVVWLEILQMCICSHPFSGTDKGGYLIIIERLLSSVLHKNICCGYSLESPRCCPRRF